MMSNPPMPEPMCTPTRFVVFRRDLQAGHLHRFLRRSDGEVDEPAHLLHFFFLDEIQRVEVLDFGGDLAGEAAMASNCVIRPHRSCLRARSFQTSRVEFPTPQISPCL